ncbi:MAG: hypothetical protein ABIQ30_06380 [Devosia sp.]
MSISLSGSKAAETQLQVVASNHARIETPERESSGGSIGDYYASAVRKSLSSAAFARSAFSTFPGRGQNVSVASNNGGLITQPTIDRAIEVISALVARYDFASGKVIRTGVDLVRLPVEGGPPAPAPAAEARTPVDKVA